MATDAIDIFREDNQQLAVKLRTLVNKAVDKSITLVDEAETVYDLLTAIKVAEIAGKVTGIVPKETINNVQINAIAGFTFIEIDKDSIVQEEVEIIESKPLA